MSDAPRTPFDEFIKVDGYLIAFEFTMSLDNGQVLDNNRGKDPIIFQTGTDDMLPALEEEMLTMEEGETRKITLSPEKAYGPVQAKAFRDFPLESIPQEARQVGRKVMSRTPDGSEQMVDVVEVTEDKVVLDFNHELAGKTLVFEITIFNKQLLG